MSNGSYSDSTSASSFSILRHDSWLGCVNLCVSADFLKAWHAEPWHCLFLLINAFSQRSSLITLFHLTMCFFHSVVLFSLICHGHVVCFDLISVAGVRGTDKICVIPMWQAKIGWQVFTSTPSNIIGSNVTGLLYFEVTPAKRLLVNLKPHGSARAWKVLNFL